MHQCLFVITSLTLDILTSISNKIGVFHRSFKPFPSNVVRGNSNHDSAINGRKSQRTGGSGETGTAGGHRSATGAQGRENADLCGSLTTTNFEVRSTYCSPLSSSFCLSTSSECPPANRWASCHSARPSPVTLLPLYLSWKPPPLFPTRLSRVVIGYHPYSRVQICTVLCQPVRWIGEAPSSLSQQPCIFILELFPTFSDKQTSTRSPGHSGYFNFSPKYKKNLAILHPANHQLSSSRSWLVNKMEDYRGRRPVMSHSIMWSKHNYVLLKKIFF